MTRRCTCRPGCLAPTYPTDRLTASGALRDHAAALARRTAPTAAAHPHSPLSRLAAVPTHLG